MGDVLSPAERAYIEESLREIGAWEDGIRAARAGKKAKEMAESEEEDGWISELRCYLRLLELAKGERDDKMVKRTRQQIKVLIDNAKLQLSIG